MVLEQRRARAGRRRRAGGREQRRQQIDVPDRRVDRTVPLTCRLCLARARSRRRSAARAASLRRRRGCACARRARRGSRRDRRSRRRASGGTRPRRRSNSGAKRRVRPRHFAEIGIGRETAWRISPAARTARADRRRGPRRTTCPAACRSSRAADLTTASAGRSRSLGLAGRAGASSCGRRRGRSRRPGRSGDRAGIRRRTRRWRSPAP